jgi:glycosyltransferase involved in cell wall biosynthesis
MRVGLYFHMYPQEKCGGYTFEQEILLKLCDLAWQCHHELVFYFENEPGDDIRASIMKKGLKAVQLVPLHKAQKLQRAVSKTLRELHLPSLPKAPHPLRAALESEKVELIWFVADAYVSVEDVDVPYIATVWDIEHRLQPWFPEVSQSGMWQWRENFYSTFLKRAAYILTPNEVGQKEISLFYGLPPERFRLLPLPAPNFKDILDEGKVNDVLAKYHLSRGYLFYPAGFWPHKNHANLLLALQMLKDKFGQNRHLVLVGADKGNLKYVRHLTETLGMEGQVHFLGFVPREDLIALYQGAFVLTYMSLFGPDNLPPLEAFAFGCPVIVSDYGGARQQCGDAAVFVDGLDPLKIAQAIQDLERQPEFRSALIEKGQNRASQYTSENYIKDVFAIFDEFKAVRRNWGSTY